MKVKSVLGGTRKRIINSLTDLIFESHAEEPRHVNAELITQLMRDGCKGWREMSDEELLKALKDEYDFVWEEFEGDEDDEEADINDEAYDVIRLYNEAKAQLAIHNIVLKGE